MTEHCGHTTAVVYVITRTRHKTFVACASCERAYLAERRERESELAGKDGS